MEKCREILKVCQEENKTVSNLLWESIRDLNLIESGNGYIAQIQSSFIEQEPPADPADQSAVSIVFPSGYSNPPLNPNPLPDHSPDPSGGSDQESELADVLEYFEVNPEDLELNTSGKSYESEVAVSDGSPGTTKTIRCVATNVEDFDELEVNVTKLNSPDVETRNLPIEGDSSDSDAYEADQFSLNKKLEGSKICRTADGRTLLKFSQAPVFSDKLLQKWKRKVWFCS